MIDIILKIKETFLEYTLTKDKKILDNLLFIYLDDLSADVELLKNVNFFIKTDRKRFYNSLRYLAFLYDYNLDEERYITAQEQLSVDIVLLELDDDENVIPNEPTDFERFEIYKNKFMD